VKHFSLFPLHRTSRSSLPRTNLTGLRNFCRCRSLLAHFETQLFQLPRHSILFFSRVAQVGPASNARHALTDKGSTPSHHALVIPASGQTFDSTTEPRVSNRLSLSNGNRSLMFLLPLLLQSSFQTPISALCGSIAPLDCL
jgi:hypothetical protein